MLSGYTEISIHALREEGDAGGLRQDRAPADFYPRPPRGGRPQAEREFALWSEFLSTPSARRATQDAAVPAAFLFDFYPRPPRGGRLGEDLTNQVEAAISIHALREEGDRGTTGRGACHSISIHALREEGDIEAYIKPLGLRLFLSTPSARRATSGAAPASGVS